MANEEMIKLLTEIRDLQKANLEKYDVYLTKTEAKYDQYLAKARNQAQVLLLIVTLVLLVFLGLTFLRF